MFSDEGDDVDESATMNSIFTMLNCQNLVFKYKPIIDKPDKAES